MHALARCYSDGGGRRWSARSPAAALLSQRPVSLSPQNPLPTTIAFVPLRSAPQGRMYGNGKGIADSALPYKRTPPSWLKTTAGEVQDHGEPFELLEPGRCVRPS
jgi:hypothetical protein